MMKSGVDNHIGRLFLVVLVSLVSRVVPVSAGVDVWTSNGPIDNGVRVPVTALAVDPSAPATLYAGSWAADFGVFKSTDGGASWPLRSAHFLQVVALVRDPSASATLYAGTNSWDTANGVFKSTDGGVNWADSLLNRTISVLAIDPSAPATVYAGTLFTGFVKSTDRGMTWTTLDLRPTDSFVNALAIDPARSSTIYAGTSDYLSSSGGVFKSTDGGATWSAINSGLANRAIFALSIDPATTTTLYAGTSGGVFKSTDGGASWAAASTGLTNLNVRAFALDPSASRTLYAGTAGGGVFKSTDRGASWTAMNAGLTNLVVNALAIDRSAPARIYAGTDSGVYDYVAIEPSIDLRILPVIGSTPGANGTFFRTSVQLNNAGSEPAAGRIVFHPSGIAGSDSDPALSYSLVPGETLSIADLLPAMGRSGIGSADIEITSGEAPVATARVFNDAGPSGTTGFTEEAMRAEEAIPPGQKGVLLIPADLTVARFNVGIRTLEEGASVNIAVYDAAGAAVGFSTRVFPPNYHEQQDALGFVRVLEVPPGGSISMFVNSGAAIVYGATVDNRTGDPSLQIASWSPWGY
jgi:photosystem II stability/assembly factor-like uncharacterized protein